MIKSDKTKRNLVVHVKLLEAIFDMIPIAVLAKDLDGNMLLGNKAAGELLGFDSDRIPGLTDETLGMGTPERLKAMHADDQIILQTGELIEREKEMLFPDGRMEWVHLVKGPIWGPSRDITGFVATLEIISDRKASELNLRESEERFRNLVDGSVQGIMVMDQDRYHFVNDASVKIFGYESKDEILSLRANYDLITPDDQERSQKFARARLAGENLPTRIQVRGLKKDKSIIVLDTIARLINWGGQPAIQATYTDITKIHRNVSEFTTQRLEAVGALAHGIAGEVTDIFGRVISALGRANTEARAIGAQKLTETLGDAKVATEELDELVQQLVVLFRGGVPTKERVSPLELVSDSLAGTVGLSNVVPLKRKAIHKVKLTIDSGLPAISVDKHQIKQVLNSLITHAIKAMPLGGVIQVSAESYQMKPSNRAVYLSPGKYVKISVKDQGAGMAVDAIKRVFDPYYMTDKIADGLGLGTAFSIVRNHEGTMTAHSKPGRGVRITLYLPI